MQNDQNKWEIRCQFKMTPKVYVLSKMVTIYREKKTSV